LGGGKNQRAQKKKKGKSGPGSFNPGGRRKLVRVKAKWGKGGVHKGVKKKKRGGSMKIHENY